MTIADWHPYPVEEERKRIEDRIARQTPHTMYFCHMDVKYADQPWTEGETVKTFSKAKALENFKEVQALREKGILVKNLKLCNLTVIVEQVEEGETK